MFYIFAKFHSICTSCRIMAYIFICITFLLLETDLLESDMVAAGGGSSNLELASETPTTEGKHHILIPPFWILKIELWLCLSYALSGTRCLKCRNLWFRP